MSGKLEFNFRNTMEDVAASGEFLRRFSEESGLSERQGYLLLLAYEELAANIVKYAFDGKSGHRIKVLAEHNDRGVFLTLMDDGRPFDPVTAALPEPDGDLAERASGGMGLRMIREMARSMRYVRENAWNVVRVQI